MHSPLHWSGQGTTTTGRYLSPQCKAGVRANSCSLPLPFHRAESDKQRRLLFSVAGLSAMLVLGLVAVALRTTGAAPS